MNFKSPIFGRFEIKSSSDKTSIEVVFLDKKYTESAMIAMREIFASFIEEKVEKRVNELTFDGDFACGGNTQAFNKNNKILIRCDFDNVTISDKFLKEIGIEFSKISKEKLTSISSTLIKGSSAKFNFDKEKEAQIVGNLGKINIQYDPVEFSKKIVDLLNIEKQLKYKEVLGEGLEEISASLKKNDVREKENAAHAFPNRSSLQKKTKSKLPSHNH